MARLIKRTNNAYTNVSNKVVRDSNLSWKARGIFLYLWSQADNWKFYVSEIEKHSVVDGRESLQNGLKELEKAGYLIRSVKFDETKQIKGMEWFLSDYPSNGKPVGRESRPRGNPSLRTTNNKNYQKQEILNTSKNHCAANAAPEFPWQSVIDYLNEKTGKHFKHTNTNKGLVMARQHDGFSAEDMQKVIDHQCKLWLNNKDMAQYLRPSTLFRASKFEGYLNAVPDEPKHEGREYWTGG